jgi:hypothetical protein
VRDKKTKEDPSEQEIARLRDNAIRRALNTAPKPYKDAIGKSGRKAKPKRPQK